MQGAVESFFHHDLFHLDPVFDLVELAIMGYGKVISYRALFLDTEDIVEFSIGQRGSVNISLGCGRDPEFTVVYGQPPFQKLIGLLHGMDASQSHLFDQPILEGTKQPFNPPFGLRAGNGRE